MVSRGLRPILLACTSLIVLAGMSPARAQQAEVAQPDGAETALQTLVVKGNRVRQGAPEDTPLATRTTAGQIAGKEIDDLDDLGDTTEPGVTFVDATKSVNIRGLEGDRVLTTIDGIPIPYLADGVRGSQGGTDTYDFSSLSGIDILRGADSSRSGSGALGGAVILHTLEPEDLIADGETLGGVAKLTYDGAERGLTGAAAAAKRIDNTSVLFQTSYKYGHETETNGEIGGTGPTRTEADPVDINRRNLLFKVRQTVEGGHTIGLTAEHYDQNGTKDYRSFQGMTFTPGDYDQVSDKKRDRLSLDYFFESESGESWIDSAFATVYVQRAERIEGTHGTRITPPIGYYSRLSTNEERGYGASGYANSTFDTGSLAHTVTFGGDIQFARTGQFQVGEDSCDILYVSNCSFFHNNQADMPDTNATKLGAFVEDRIAFGDSAFSLTPGVRFDWYEYDPQETAGYKNIDGSPDLPHGQSDLRLSPKLRGAWQVQPDVELFAQIATGFKAPNVTQLYLNYDNAPNYRSIGNPGLKAETSYGFEAGVNLGDEDFGGRLTAYTTRYKNFIETQTTIEPGYVFGTVEYFNRTRVRISGIEARARKTFDTGIDIHASVAYARGTDLDTNELLASVPPVKAVIGAGYTTEVWGADLSLVTAASVSEKSIAATKPGGYGIVNLTGWWEPEQTEGLRLQAGIYNLFDKTYFDALEVKNIANATQLYSEADRFFKISLTQKF